MGKNEKHGSKKCWEFMECGRISGGTKEPEMGICPAYPDNGRFCWTVAGTFCMGKVCGSFAEKKNTCFFCEFYSLVRKEESADFILLDLKTKK